MVCFDGGLGLGNRAVLPRGPLREPSRALRHADSIAVIDGPLPPEDEERVRALAPAAARLAARRRPVSVEPLGGGDSLSPEALRGLKVGMLVATGVPGAFRRTLASLGAEVVQERVFPDHHRYRPRDLAPLARRASLWVTTEKDALKIVPWWPREANLWVLGVRLEVAGGAAWLDWLEARLARSTTG